MTHAENPGGDGGREVVSQVMLPAAGYAIGELLGRGGMGEVMQAYDQRIGREVAIKRMRGARPTPDQQQRFLREARIQARLDHPAVVPVYELGTDAHGQPFFTMKRLAGVTLAQRLVDDDPMHPLLRALVDVCLAVELAHSRGIVHRDLKPANIMLGDYGEVYVLDWGVARVISDDPHAPPVHDIDTLDDGTQTGAMLGTPGYMSPEQIRSLPATPGADVYALGSILFEILAGEPLHPRGTAALASTLNTPCESAARRRPDRAVPPELDAACQAALAESPEQRPTARQLADQIQAYLDGDRDLDRRRRLAREQLVEARSGLASPEPGARAAVIQRAGRALALDPESTEAAQLVTKLIVEPPQILPAELLESLDAEERKAARTRGSKAVRALLALFVWWLFIPFIDVLSWAWLGALFGGIAALVVFMRHTARTGDTNIKLVLALQLGIIIAWSRVAGPYMLSPALICGSLMVLSANRWLNPRLGLAIGWTVTATVLPVLLEWVGLLAPTVKVHPEYIWTHSTVFRIAGGLGDALLLGANVLTVLIVALVTMSNQRAIKDAQRQLHVQAWHLRQLIPSMPQA